MRNEPISRFEVFLKSERGLAEATIVEYVRRIEEFRAQLRKPLKEASKEDVQKYITRIHTSGMAPSSVAGYHSALKEFFRFLLDEDEIETDPSRNISRPKLRRPLPKALSEEQFEKLVNSLGQDHLSVRDRAMLFLFFGAGLRVSELANLRLADLTNGAIKVWAGKGRKDGVVPLNARAFSEIQTYIQSVRPHLETSESHTFVFLGDKGGRPLTRQAIWVRVRTISEEALGRAISPHYLRHGYGTALVKGGADIRDVQVLMRHASVDTTQIYIHTDLKYLKEVYYATHPRAHFA
jgi:integrase/recombinase XerD